MKFRVTSRMPTGKRLPDTVYLWPTGWDDWFKFSTLYNVIYSDPKVVEHQIGHTKIGQFDLRPAGKSEPPRPGYRTPDLPERFTRLGDDFFSLGQDTSYYEALTAISPDFRESFLRAINDIAFAENIRERAQTEPVTAVSLLRDVPLRTVQGQFSRLANGGARLTPYDFNIIFDSKHRDTTSAWILGQAGSPATYEHPRPYWKKWRRKEHHTQQASSAYCSQLPKRST